MRSTMSNRIVSVCGGLVLLSAVTVMTGCARKAVRREAELDPALLAASKLVADLTEQCAVIGDLHHALAAGAMTRSDVHAELGEIVAGLKSARASKEETIVFDSSGTALQDVAAAVAVYRQAIRDGGSPRFSFNG
jgi:ornithine cyclodeaminase/alanine dehydrogenase-like protein (mu-crystallin family)